MGSIVVLVLIIGIIIAPYIVPYSYADIVKWTACEIRPQNLGTV